MTRAPISGFVVAYNRAALLQTCLRSLRFVDDLIVIDKSSNDDTPAIARRYADRVITVPGHPPSKKPAASPSISAGTIGSHSSTMTRC